MRWFVPVYRIALAVLTFAALGVQFVANSRDLPAFSTSNFFSYFTTLTNLLAASVFLYCGLTRRPADNLRGVATLCLFTGGLVYAAALADEAESLGILYPWVDTVLHRVMPIAVLVDWILVPVARRLELRKTLRWLIVPGAYAAYSLIRGAAIDWYPYPFFDPAQSGGYLGVAAGLAVIAVAFAVLVAALTWIGNRRMRGAAPDLPAVTSSGNTPS